jgi:D-alanyl-lipoteichoic acid acyltransferase DltB (MBOAT superfamily)
MFPRLIAGPIERPHHLLPQLLGKITLKDENIYEGLKLIVFGFFKKTFLADNLALIVNTSYSNVNIFSGVYWWYSMICFSIQIYCDFSGYTDIARGLAKILGFDFSLNFKTPYSSTSFKEFWSQWHISLSTWFRDYLYIPLGGDRISSGRTHLNLWITMLVSGLWHGASWNFVLWGALHSFYLSLEKWTNWPSFLNKNGFGKGLSTFIVFTLTVIAWVFFRADSFSQALLVLQKMLTFSSGKSGIHYNILVFIGLYIHFIPKINFNTLSLFNNKKFEILLYATLALIALAFRGKAEQFIYFQF